MTQLRNAPSDISNYFDRLLHGIGHRGSSFMDIDRIDCCPIRVTHDGQTHRFLYQEFKHEGEASNAGQRRTLEALAIVPENTVWVVIKRRDGRLDWGQLTAGRQTQLYTISEVDYRSRYRRWWDNQTTTAPTTRDGMPTADEIFR